MYELPFDQTVIQRILPHRYPFLLVDRVTEFEAETRVVGIKNVSLNEQCLSVEPGRIPTLPPTILTEALAQVGAIMILGKPENHDKLIYFMGIDHMKFRKPVHAGDQVIFTATVRRLRARMGVLYGVARVNGEVVADGVVRFALGPRGGEHVTVRD